MYPHARAIIKPEPLYLDVRDETQREGTQMDFNVRSSKKELETQVLHELLRQGEYADHEMELNTLILDIRDAIVRKNGIEGFQNRVRDIAKHIKEKDFDDNDCSGEDQSSLDPSIEKKMKDV